MYRIVFLWLSSLLFLGCSQSKTNVVALPYYNTPDFTPFFISDKAAIANKIKHSISDFSFLNEDSILITQKAIEGKIHVANFIFTSCGSICPSMTSNLKMVSDSLQGNKQLVFLSYTVTPWVDKPHVLHEYKKGRGIKNAQWHFLTGTKGDIYTLARKSYFAEEDIGFSKDSTEFLHTEHFILVDKNKHIRGIYNGTLLFEMHQLIADIITLESEG